MSSTQSAAFITSTTLSPQETRNLMRKMGEASDVPIEPPTQTELLDQCDELAGVIGSGVPGGLYL